MTQKNSAEIIEDCLNIIREYELPVEPGICADIVQDRVLIMKAELEEQIKQHFGLE